MSQLLLKTTSFLRHITRVAASDYIPSTGMSTVVSIYAFSHMTFVDDILHARIQTMGVAEHVFDVSPLLLQPSEADSRPM